jgi:hypothetical protein
VYHADRIVGVLTRRALENGPAGLHFRKFENRAKPECLVCAPKPSRREVATIRQHRRRSHPQDSSHSLGLYRIRIDSGCYIRPRLIGIWHRDRRIRSRLWIRIGRWKFGIGHSGLNQLGRLIGAGGVPALALDVGRARLAFAERAAILALCRDAVATGVSAFLWVCHGVILLPCWTAWKPNHFRFFPIFPLLQFPRV